MGLGDSTPVVNLDLKTQQKADLWKKTQKRFNKIEVPSNLKIEEEIIAASFWENWKYYKELCAMKCQKRFEVRENVEKIRQEWIKVQKNIKNEQENSNGSIPDR